MHILYPVMVISVLTVLQYQGFSQAHYQYQTRGNNRREGIKNLPIGAPDIELLSCTGNQEKLAFDDDTILNIAFFLEQDTTVYLSVKELDPQTFYQMHPLKTRWLKGWNRFYPWPVRDVLSPLKLSLEQLAMIGRTDSGQIGSGKIIPLLIYHSQPALQIKRYIFYFRAKENLSQVKYALYREGHSKPIKSTILRQTFYGGVPFEITIHVANEGAGPLRFTLSCRLKNKFGGPKRSYHFYHMPEVMLVK